MLEDAEALCETAVREGWRADGAEGFVYTVDWHGAPVVRDRLHWVVTEAIAAAAALGQATGDPRYESCYRTWWDHAGTYFLDLDAGSWRHQLDASNRPSDTVWQGKPDVYHAIQATLLPQLPLSPTLAAALATIDVGPG
jgi:mannose/cellobiose epimerase-like protein (N-acyl-D-glucosamine 2-epimerase family)